jgi:hypothetical protein
VGSDVMTRREAVAYLALDRQGLRDPMEALRWLCRTGKVRYTKVGRHLCFRKQWLDELLDGKTEHGGMQ